MTNELLRNAIMRSLHRVHPTPLRRATLCAEVELALGAPLTTREFDDESSALRRLGLLAIGRDEMLGTPLYSLTRAGQAAAAKAFE